MSSSWVTLLESSSSVLTEGTAAERFAREHDAGRLPDTASGYSSLIPFDLPGEGEQFAFAVDLDRCTGCKACVAACHSLNGLDEDETWRTVGLLVGVSEEAPFQQAVTTACHHCVEPACASGCPVNAYEKDPVTGIVSHLDDQCIGCQYCVLKCPYEVPVFNERLGIVRKCDMCQDRLAVGEAPACAQACPTDAISIEIVSRDQVVADSEAEVFVPGTASPGYTLPSTRYKSRKPQPRNAVPANFYSLQVELTHLPLVVMLVLTQLAVGALAVDFGLSRFSAHVPPALLPFFSAAALGFGVLALGASTLHLGRPQYAFRALLGLRTSWMSREILAFGVFAALAAGYVASDWLSVDLPAIGSAESLRESLGLAALAAGVAGVVCSVMVYADTHRETWRASRTSLRFFATAVTLGATTVLATSLIAAAFLDDADPRGIARAFGATLARVAAVTLAYELARELAGLRHVRSRRHTALKRRALLLLGELQPVLLVRVASAAVALGAALLFVTTAYDTATTSAALIAFAGTAFAATLVTEFTERILFFAASVAPRMPGSPGP